MATAQAGSGPAILAVDLNGSPLQSLLHACRDAGRDVDVLCSAATSALVGQRATGPTLALLAHAQWGTRALRQAARLVAIGEPLRRMGWGPKTVQLMALEIHVRLLSARQVGPPAWFCVPGARSQVTQMPPST